MIARISGVLLSKQPAQVVIDVQGVAYEIEISFNSFCKKLRLKIIVLVGLK